MEDDHDFDTRSTQAHLFEGLAAAQPPSQVDFSIKPCKVVRLKEKAQFYHHSKQKSVASAARPVQPGLSARA